MIKGNHVAKLQPVFNNAKIRELIEARPRINFRVKDDENSISGGKDFPPDVDELYFRVPGVIRDVDRLKQLSERNVLVTGAKSTPRGSFLPAGTIQVRWMASGQNQFAHSSVWRLDLSHPQTDQSRPPC